MKRNKTVNYLLIGIFSMPIILYLIGRYFFSESSNTIYLMISISSGLILLIVLIITMKKGVEKSTPIKNDFGIIPENKVELKICKICNTENRQNAKYCKKCGTDLLDITCPVCNTINSFDQKYCKECNTILQNVKRH